MCVCVCVSVSVSTCVSVTVSVCLFVCLCLSVCLSVFLSICVHAHVNFVLGLNWRQVPFIIRRRLPNGTFEDWAVNELLIEHVTLQDRYEGR